VKSARGQIVNHTAVAAPSANAAAEYYPAIYWLAMLKIPDKSLFPGTGLDGNGMPANYKTQEQWLRTDPPPLSPRQRNSISRRDHRHRKL
jgi:hypothetical protein